MLLKDRNACCVSWHTKWNEMSGSVIQFLRGQKNVSICTEPTPSQQKNRTRKKQLQGACQILLFHVAGFCSRTVNSGFLNRSLSIFHWYQGILVPEATFQIVARCCNVGAAGHQPKEASLCSKFPWQDLSLQSRWFQGAKCKRREGAWFMGNGTVASCSLRRHGRR